MVSRYSRYLMFAMGMLAGLAIGFGFGQMRYVKLEKVSQARAKEIGQRLSQAQRRYAQQVANQNACEDARQALQSELEKAGKEKEELASENRKIRAGAGSLASSVAALEKKVAVSEGRAISLEARNSQIGERLAAVEAERAALEQKERQTARTLKEREKDLKTLDGKYDRCAEQNARLCLIGGELVEKYRNKGVMTSLLHKEPVTQIKRVELEKLTREYREKIDQQKMRSK